MARQTNARRAAPTCDVFAIHERRVRAVARRVLKGPAVSRLAGTFRALGHPTRIRLVDALSHAEMCVCDLAVLLDMRISTVSHQLALLKRLKIVSSRRDGKMLYYRLDDQHVQTLFDQTRAHAEHGEPGAAGTPKRRLKSAGVRA